jgi:hypothetical protein
LKKGGKIALMPKSLLDRHIEESLEDIRQGRTYGPFDTAEEMVESLQRNLNERSAKTSKTKRSQ